VPLSFNLKEIQDYESVCYQEAKGADGSVIVGVDGNPKASINSNTQYIIYMTMYIGIPSISEDNWRDFYRRTIFYEKLFEPRSSGLLTTAQEVRGHIGLRTNAKSMTDSQYANHIWRCFNRENQP